MRVLSTSKNTYQEIVAALQKPNVDEEGLGPAAQAKITALFGKPLSASQAVAKIIHDIKRHGDQALIDYTAKIDGVELKAGELFLDPQEIGNAYRQVDQKFLTAVRTAKARIEKFHRKELTNSWLTYEDDGIILGQRVSPLERVGLYVPGGTAAYPSSVLMNAIPAIVAGVKEIIMAVPPSGHGAANPYLLVTAGELGITKVLRTGGAQAVAALAYGTASVPKVDKIVGPGNIFVTLAKKMVYGTVDIDKIAGPSEIVVVADETANPRFVAADLLSQAEHDVLASAICLTTSAALAEEVIREVSVQAARLSRREIIEESLNRYGVVVVAKDLAEAIELANLCAPEHLELMVADPWQASTMVKHAGAVFLGPYSSEPVGDYMAGPNHVLPTSGTARFYSPLGVDDFVKKSSIIAYSRQGLAKVAEQIIDLANVEGLSAHANAIKVRVEDENV